MTKKQLIIFGAAALVLLIALPMTAGAHTTAIFSVADQIIPQFEGFSPTPYWDVSRWSWGFGTQAPGPDGTITREQATQEMNSVLLNNFNGLYPKITRTLTPNQWGALLSFAYNEGEGGADNLIADINAGNDTVLETHWKKYIYAGGVVNSDLVDRRDAEWNLWQS